MLLEDDISQSVKQTTPPQKKKKKKGQPFVWDMTHDLKLIIKQALQVHTGDQKVFRRFQCFWE